MVGADPGVVKRDLALRKGQYKSMIFQIILSGDWRHSSPTFSHAFRHVPVSHENDCANNRNGVTRMAT